MTKIALDNEESILNGGCNVPTSHKTYKQDAFLYEKRFGMLNIRNNLLIKYNLDTIFMVIILYFFN